MADGVAVGAGVRVGRGVIVSVGKVAVGVFVAVCVIHPASNNVSIVSRVGSLCRRIMAIYFDANATINLVFQLIASNIKLLIQCGISEAHSDLVRFTNNANTIPYINIVANDERSSMPGW